MMLPRTGALAGEVRSGSIWDNISRVESTGLEGWVQSAVGENSQGSLQEFVLPNWINGGAVCQEGEHVRCGMCSI